MHANTTVNFKSLSFELRPEGADAWIVHLNGQLHGGSDRHGDLLLIGRRGPVTLVACEAKGWRVERSDDLSRDEVRLRVHSSDAWQRGWSGISLQLTLRWMPGMSAAPGESLQQTFAASCLVLPDMLPQLVEEAAPLGDAPRALTELSLASELPPGLDAGGVARPDERGQPSPALLQSVIYPMTAGTELFADLAIADASVDRDPSALRSAHAYASPFLGFLRRELPGPFPLRPVICLTERHGVAMPHLPAGAYCPIAADDVGARKANSGKPRSVVMLLSQAWFDAGVRLWGENAHTLRLALGAALGMRWLEAAGEAAALKRFLDTAESMNAAAAKRGTWSVTEVVLVMQLPIFRGMQRNGLTSKLGELLRSRWGEFVPQSDVVALLRDSGVAVPHVFE